MKLRKYLDKHGISDAEFGRRIGKSRSYVTKLAQEVFQPALTAIERIEKETGGEVLVDDFMRKARLRKPVQRPSKPLVAA